MCCLCDFRLKDFKGSESIWLLNSFYSNSFCLRFLYCLGMQRLSLFSVHPIFSTLLLGVIVYLIVSRCIFESVLRALTLFINFCCFCGILMSYFLVALIVFLYETFILKMFRVRSEELSRCFFNVSYRKYWHILLYFFTA